MATDISKTKCIGILTAGGDCPGLNAAIRAITKAAIQDYGIKVIGIEDGFRGLVENRVRPLSYNDMSGMLALGGTILGTSRDKPNKMPMGQKVLDMTGTAVENARKNGFDCVVCLGGGGTQKNALQLKKAGLDVLTLPKTIDNDVGGTDYSFGFDTALDIATSAIDRLHTTASSHNRIIMVETMGHKTGWLALGSGMAGGADVVLIPEIPYDLDSVAEYLLDRQLRFGKKFSIVTVAEGAKSRDEAKVRQKLVLNRVEKRIVPRHFAAFRTISPGLAVKVFSLPVIAFYPGQGGPPHVVVDLYLVLSRLAAIKAGVAAAHVPAGRFEITDGRVTGSQMRAVALGPLAPVLGQGLFNQGDSLRIPSGVHGIPPTLEKHVRQAILFLRRICLRLARLCGVPDHLVHIYRCGRRVPAGFFFITFQVIGMG